jgi:hypothetical protein
MIEEQKAENSPAIGTANPSFVELQAYLMKHLGAYLIPA